MRQIINWNEDWKFCLDDQACFATYSYDDIQWRSLDLPHDWDSELELSKDAPSGAGGGYAAAGTGWYRRHFEMSPLPSGERIFIAFDGIYMDCTIYLNGQRAGSREYGYNAFQVDITDKLRKGENLLAVRVDNSHQPNSRWYTGSGIYRNVWLVRTGLLHIDFGGVRCYTEGLFPEKNQASLSVRTFLRNHGQEKNVVCLRHEIFDESGMSVSSSVSTLSVPGGGQEESLIRFSIDTPRLWSNEDPFLYTLVTTVTMNHMEVDRISTPIGIRTALFHPDKGFLLNGNPVKIKGMCLHHDCGLTGAAGHMEIWKRRLTALKDMGCNGIRCAHNPPAAEFLDLCDQMGFLVVDEIFDEWLTVKKKSPDPADEISYGTGCFFGRYAETELCSMLRRDFNHPSVILWSIGNEIPEQASREGVKILQRLQDICHREDPSRMVTCACDNITAAGASCTLREFENTLDVVGYNYVGRWRKRAETFYEEDRTLYPERRFLGSENPGAGGLRGDYSDMGFRDSFQAVLTHQALWRYTATHDFVAGDYLWTGVDYLGESRWPYRGASFAPLDTACFPKDSFYYFRSLWNEKEITLHLLPHWNWKGQEGIFKQIICYTNCDEVFLYCNGRLVGRQAYVCPRYGLEDEWIDDNRSPTTNDLHLSWDVPYEAGELRAEGFRNGKLAAVRVISTTGAAANLTACPDRTNLHPKELALIEISCTDGQGRPVPDASLPIHCQVEGCAHLTGMDGGDPRDLSLYGNNTRKMLAGHLLAAVQADRVGTTLVTFSAEGIADVTVTLQIQPAIPTSRI